MKKNIETENKNMVNNAVVAEPIMSEEEMQQYVEQNIHMVPKNQSKKFEKMTLQQKVSKIKFYYDIQKLKEDAKIKNSIPNRVKDLFESKHGTVEDAKTVMRFCQEFIDGFKQREIEKLDAEIRKLQLMKESLNA